MLVAKQLIPEIILSRLPTGHIHEDIDELFGHLWSSYRLNPCLTLSEYKEYIYKVFSGTSHVEVDLIDVKVIASYDAFLEPLSDKISLGKRRPNSSSTAYLRSKT